MTQVFKEKGGNDKLRDWLDELLVMCPAKLANNFFDVLKKREDLSIQRKFELLPPVIL